MFYEKVRWIFYLNLLMFYSLFSQSMHKEYVSSRLYGRLGNQMFQVAAAVSLAIDNNAVACFPDLIKKKGDGIPTNYKFIFSKLNSYRPKRYSFIHKEHKNMSYSPINYKKNMCLDGFFQSEKYFAHNKEEICNLFSPKPAIKTYLYKKYKNIIDHPNTVAIHLRAYEVEDKEKSYDPKLETIFPFLKTDYYFKAADLFAEDAFFIIFSDKISWAKKVLKDFSRPHIFIENEKYYHDFYLMSFCKHHINSPSSFSWWAAYLNKNPDKIIVTPFPWFLNSSKLDTSSIVPNEWIKLPYN